MQVLSQEAPPGRLAEEGTLASSGSRRALAGFFVSGLLIAFLAYNLFHAFRLLNLKPEIRHGKTRRYWARLMAREICQDTCFAAGPSP